MADRINFTGVQLLGFQRNQQGGTANFSASLTESVMKALEWETLPECLTKCTPEGELDTQQIEIKPTDKGMARHAVQLDATRIYHFQVVRLELEQTRGKGHRFELRFTVKFSDTKGARKLEEYILTCGKSSLSASYTKQATQQDLPGVEVQATEEQRQAVLEDA